MGKRSKRRIRKISDRIWRTKLEHIILATDEFNSFSSEWTFLLIGQDYDATVEMEIQDKRTGLAIKKNNFTLYVKNGVL